MSDDGDEGGGWFWDVVLVTAAGMFVTGVVVGMIIR